VFHLTVFHYIVLFDVINVVPVLTYFTVFYSIFFVDTPIMHWFKIWKSNVNSCILCYLPWYVFNLYEPGDELFVGRNMSQNFSHESCKIIQQGYVIIRVNWYSTLPTGVVASRRTDRIIVHHLDTVPAFCSPNYEVPCRTDDSTGRPTFLCQRTTPASVGWLAVRTWKITMSGLPNRLYYCAIYLVYT
jgi:hypothetical protein